MVITGKKLQEKALPVFLAALLVLSAASGIFSPVRSEAADAPFVVYLQAGHSPSNKGSGNIQGGIKEAVLNEQVTLRTYKAMKAQGLNVMLLNPIALDRTLPSIIKAAPGENGQYAYYSPEPAMLTACAWPERFDKTFNKQADVLVALHHNAYTDKSVRGYEIYYATTSGGDYGRTDAHVAGSKKLADYMGQEFAKGFYVPARTPAVRVNNSNNGLTKNAPMAAVLVEAGYMSNAADLDACRKSENQETLAKRVTSAVMRYKQEYWPSIPVPVNIVSTALNATYSTSANQFSVDTVLTPAESVQSVRAAIWPKDADVSTAKWYNMTHEGAGRYALKVSGKDFGLANGTYTVSIHVTDKNGNQKSVASAYATLDNGDHAGPTAASVTASLVSANSTMAVVTAAGVQDPAGVESVRFAVWSEAGGQDDLYWYPAIHGAGEWSAVVRTTNHLDKAGTYIVHAYGTDAYGNEAFLGAASITFSHKDTSPPELYGELRYTKIGNNLVVTASDVRDASGVKGVRVAFWSTNGSQADLRWYPCSLSGTGSEWAAVVNLSNHQNPNGRYTMHVYAADEKGNDGMIAGLSFRLGAVSAGPTADGVTVLQRNSATADVVVTGVSDETSPVSSVDIAVWPLDRGQADIQWFPASKLTSSTWAGQISAEKFSGAKGPYSVHVYATDEDDNRALVATTSFTFTETVDTSPPSAKSVTTDRTLYTGRNAVVSINGVTDDTSVARVWIQVCPVSDENSAKTSEAVAAGDGNWTATFNWPQNFSEPGAYRIEAYAQDAAGNKALVGTVRTSVDSAAVRGYEIMGKSQATVAQLVNAQLKSGWNNAWYGMTVEEFCTLYYDLCAAEGVKAEVAYAQMLHETAGLRYGNLVIRAQNNFAGLGATGGLVEAASQKTNHRYTEDGRDAGICFTSVANGIRSHIQHLKGYASTASLVLPKVPEYDRFGYMERGCAPTVLQLSGRWATDPEYGDRLNEYVNMIYSQSKNMPVIDTVIPQSPALTPRASLEEAAPEAPPILETDSGLPGVAPAPPPVPQSSDE